MRPPLDPHPGLPHPIPRWFSICFHTCTVSRFFDCLSSARYSSVIAASSEGNDARLLIIFLNDMCSDTTALVVYSAFRIPSGNAKTDMDWPVDAGQIDVLDAPCVLLFFVLMPLFSGERLHSFLDTLLQPKRPACAPPTAIRRARKNPRSGYTFEISSFHPPATILDERTSGARRTQRDMSCALTGSRPHLPERHHTVTQSTPET